MEHQIMISYNAELDCPKYRHLTIGGASVDVTFLNILGLKFDLMQRELLVKEFINKTLKRFAKELNIEPTRVFVIISLNKEDNDFVVLHLYSGLNFIKQISLEQLIGM